MATASSPRADSRASRRPITSSGCRKLRLGISYDVMTNGFGIMPDYASQIPPRDRWNIVAYIRALQLSQNATMADVPAGQKVPSEPPEVPASRVRARRLPVHSTEAESELRGREMSTGARDTISI